MSFVSNWLVPIIQVVFFIGFFGFLGYIITRAVLNGWTKKYKFVVKYKVLRKPYPISIVTWCVDNLDNDLSFHDVKKFLMVKSVAKSELNEILWIYEQLINELKGGYKNGRKFKRFGNEATTTKGIPKYTPTELPKD